MTRWRVEQDGVAPVFYREEETTYEAGPSLSALFSYWTEQIATGESYVDARDRRWRATDNAREAWIAGA